MRLWAVVVMVLWMLGTTHDARAEHTVDHRYTIWGYVKDAAGVPIKDTRVVISDHLHARLGVTRTDTNGRYSTRLHLHNSDLGRQLTIEAHQVSHQLRVTFDTDDTFSERRHRIDFLGSQVQETLPASRSLTPYVLLAFGAAVVLIPAFLYVRGRGKRKGRGVGRPRQRSPKERAEPRPRHTKQPGRRR